MGRILAGSTYRALTDWRSGSDRMQSTGSAYTASAGLLEELGLVGMDGRGMRVMGACGLSSGDPHFLSSILKVGRAAALLPGSGDFGRAGALVGDSWV